MVKIRLSYKIPEEKKRILKQLSEGNSIKTVSKPYKTGDYYRVYIELE